MSKTSFIFMIAGTFLSCVIASTAQAASGVSARYDGFYSGTAEPAVGRAQAHCAPFTLDNVAISNGYLKSPGVKGFITEEGYLSASMTGPGMKEAALDGRLQGDTIVAGYIDDQQKCNWVVKLRKQP